MQGVDELADGDFGVVAVHHVDVEIIGLEAVEGFLELGGDGGDVGVGRMRALCRG